jgi:RHS repeat-associated protein
MYNADGNVTRATSFDPYGSPFEQFGLGQTNFGFTGEQTDSNDLQYLRARYYDPSMGTFLSHDPMSGFPGSSQSYNGCSYSKSNLIK